MAASGDTLQHIAELVTADASSTLTNTEIKSIKIKIKKLIASMVQTHIDEGGYYFESTDNELVVGTPLDLRVSNANPRTIANILAPYLVWVTLKYMCRFFKLDGNSLFQFSKKQINPNTEYYQLDYTPTPLIAKNLSTLMMFMVVVFKDHFASSEKNKIVLNRLNYLVNHKD